MRVLFYHDPVPELGRPFLWKYFVQWTAGMRNALPDVNCRFLMADSLRGWAEGHGIPGGEIVGVREERLREAASVTAHNWNRHWFEERFTPEEARRTGEFLAESLDGFVPDIVLAHTPAPFLRAVYPQAPVLHFESGLLKFAPFPMSFYFDPEGFFGHSYLANHAAELRGLSLTPGQHAQLNGLRTLFLDDLLAAKSPFRTLMAGYSDRYPRRILLPLQFGNFFGFDSNCPFHSQFEYARWVLERTPRDIGVVLTQHIYFHQLEDEAMAFLKASFPNFIHEPLFDDYNTASQFLLADVDAVVTVTSSVGMQSLWWRKPLITIGKSHLTVASDGDDPAEAHQIIERRWQPWKDALLYWLLTHYYVPEEYVYAANWLPRFLERMTTAKSFEPVDSDDRVMETIARGVIRDIGRPAGNPARAFEIVAQERLVALEAATQEAENMRREAEKRGELIDELTVAVREREARLAALEERQRR